MTMVRESYAILYRPASVQFLPSAIIDGETIQALPVVGREGTVKVALYSWSARRMAPGRSRPAS